MSVTAYLSLGSNVGNREKFISDGISRLKSLSVDGELQVSHLYESEPWGGVNQRSFINCAVAITTSLQPERLLQELKRIEVEVGRVERSVRWSERELDIDILLFGDQVISTDKLTVPHKYLMERHFMLATLFDIDPTVTVPPLNVTVERALDECTDRSWVKRLLD